MSASPVVTPPVSFGVFSEHVNELGAGEQPTIVIVDDESRIVRDGLEHPSREPDVAEADEHRVGNHGRDPLALSWLELAQDRIVAQR